MVNFTRRRLPGYRVCVPSMMLSLKNKSDCMLGLNADITPVTAGTLLRWIGMPTASCQDSRIVLKKVKLEQRGLLKYDILPLDTLEDSTILEKGVYGYFLEGEWRKG